MIAWDGGSRGVVARWFRQATIVKWAEMEGERSGCAQVEDQASSMECACLGFARVKTECWCSVRVHLSKEV